MGVESAKNLCKISTKAGVNTTNGYFNYLLSKKIHKKFDIIHGSGVMFHLEEINSAFKGIKFLLKENGVLVIEFLYLKTIVDKYHFDQIYHEHLFYYNIETLNNFLNKYKLEIFDYDYTTIHGGQIVAYICHKGVRKISAKLRNVIKLEINQKVNSPHYFKKFCAVLKKSKNIPAKYFNKLKNQSKFIVGLGAPAKGNTLMNYYNINNYQVDLLLEKNFLRKNTLSPGSNIPIMMENDLKIKPDIILVLIWNLKKDIKLKIRKKFKGSKFIFPKSFLRI